METELYERAKPESFGNDNTEITAHINAQASYQVPFEQPKPMKKQKFQILKVDIQIIKHGLLGP